HFEVQIVSRVGCARAGEVAELWKNGNEIVGFQPFGRHAHVRSEFVDLQLASRLDPRKRGDGGHFRAQIKSSQPAIEQADVARNRSEEHTSELQSLAYLVCRPLLEKQKT